MSMISNSIENFILQLLRISGEAELARNELAQKFHCAPSQINYVLQTRFGVDRGYIVTSRRGGGGYVRIMRVDANKHDYLLNLINERIGVSLTRKEAADIVRSLPELGCCSNETARVMSAVVNAGFARDDPAESDIIRAEALRRMIMTLMQEG